MSTIISDSMRNKWMGAIENFHERLQTGYPEFFGDSGSLARIHMKSFSDRNLKSK